MSKSTSTSTKFSVTIGLVAGYTGNAMLEAAKAAPDMGAAWQKAAKAVFEKKGVYVSCVCIPHTRAIYSTDWGCPVGGEPTCTFEGSRNPQFCPDEGRWREAVLKVVGLVKKAYSQSTVTVEFSEVEQVYLTE